MAAWRRGFNAVYARLVRRHAGAARLPAGEPEMATGLRAARAKGPPLCARHYAPCGKAA
ncbi:hypothetical protein [Tsuneonella suprasediminis]|uniref:hypothetical protein n=1 Tax=Tsuneonella suprasediminis TaxID=2306996 RepID=UPI001402370D|nr:hypothetical protein [Tsuneonella suprasediminis]